MAPGTLNRFGDSKGIDPISHTGDSADVIIHSSAIQNSVFC